MVGLPHSKTRNTQTPLHTQRLLLALLAVLSLVAAACSGSDATQVASDQVDTDQVVGEDQEATFAGSTDDAPLAQTIAFALENSDGQSYSFSQGMAMRMNFAGQELNIVTDEAYVFGEVDGDNVYMEMDMGIFMGATFSSLGVDVTQAPFDQVFSALDDASIETWADETTLVMDISDFASAMSGLDPTAAGDIAEFAEGPVKIDLTKIDGIDLTTLANEFGQGAQVTNPSDLLQALRAVDAVAETGTDTVNGVDVRVFTAALPLPDYYDALGLDFNEQLDAANLGEFAPGDADELNAILPVLEEISMSLIVMIDGDDLVRRMDTSIDMGAMLTAISSDPAAAELDPVFGDAPQMILDTWQEFDNYGAAFFIEPPDAVDITAEFELDN